MGISTRIYKQNRNEKYEKWALEDSKKERAVTKLLNKEREKIDPICVRRNIAIKLTQQINNDQREVYEVLYKKLDERADELYNLIIADLGLDEDPNAPLSPCTIYNIMNYYESKGLSQLKASVTEEVMKFNSSKLSPYEKLFKNLIAKRAEFLIVAPKGRLTLNAPYKKIKEEECKIELVKHLAELKVIPRYEFREKFPALAKLYDEIKDNNVGV